VGKKREERRSQTGKRSVLTERAHKRRRLGMASAPLEKECIMIFRTREKGEQHCQWKGRTKGGETSLNDHIKGYRKKRIASGRSRDVKRTR